MVPPVRALHLNNQKFKPDENVHDLRLITIKYALIRRQSKDTRTKWGGIHGKTSRERHTLASSLRLKKQKYFKVSRNLLRKNYPSHSAAKSFRAFSRNQTDELAES